MPDYYTDSARKSLWVLTAKTTVLYDKSTHEEFCLTCFAADNSSGYHIGQQVSNPKLENSNWRPLEGEITVSEILC